MRRVIVIVEGETEEEFCNRSLCPYLWDVAAIKLSATRIPTSPGHKGGLQTFERARKFASALCKQQSGAWVTTMFDLFRLPKSFPCYGEAATLRDVYDKVEMLEKAFETAVGCSNFIPYFQLHEFEALVFVDLEKLTSHYPIFKPKVLELQQSVTVFETPEHINHDSGPSKRLEQAFKSLGYRKRLHSVEAAANTPLASLREHCKHFDAWLKKIETLASH